MIRSKYTTLYALLMERYGNPFNEKFVLEVWTNKDLALESGLRYSQFRAGKFEGRAVPILVPVGTTQMYAVRVESESIINSHTFASVFRTEAAAKRAASRYKTHPLAWFLDYVPFTLPEAVESWREQNTWLSTVTVIQVDEGTVPE